MLNIGNTWSALAAGDGRAAAVRRRRTSPRSAARTASSPPRWARPAPRARTRRRCRSTPWRTASTTTRSSFEDAGIAKPAGHLGRAGRRRQEADRADGKYGLAVEGANHTENIHHAFILAKQHGARLLRRRRASPTFTAAGAVAARQAVRRLHGQDKIAAPGNAEYAQNQSLQRLRQGQGGDAAVAGRARPRFKSARHEGRRLGRRPGARAVRDARARARRSTPWWPASTSPSSRTPRTSTARLKFVKFMTSDDEQKILNARVRLRSRRSRPPRRTRRLNPEQAVLRQGSPRAPRRCRRCPTSRSSRRLVGTAVKDLFADAAGRQRDHHRHRCKAELPRPSSRCRRSEDRDSMTDHRPTTAATPGGAGTLPRPAARASPARRGRIGRIGRPVPPAAARPAPGTPRSTWCRWSSAS